MYSDLPDIPFPSSHHGRKMGEYTYDMPVYKSPQNLSITHRKCSVLTTMPAEFEGSLEDCFLWKKEIREQVAVVSLAIINGVN